MISPIFPARCPDECYWSSFGMHAAGRLAGAIDPTCGNIPAHVQRRATANAGNVFQGEEVKEMPTHAHPMDDAIFDLALVRRQMIEDFVADDGVVCEAEGRIVSLFDDAVGTVSHVRLVQKANAHLERMPKGECTRYSRRLFRDAGYQLESLDGQDGELDDQQAA